MKGTEKENPGSNVLEAKMEQESNREKKLEIPTHCIKICYFGQQKCDDYINYLLVFKCVHKGFLIMKYVTYRMKNYK